MSSQPAFLQPSLYGGTKCDGQEFVWGSSLCTWGHDRMTWAIDIPDTSWEWAVLATSCGPLTSHEWSASEDRSRCQLRQAQPLLKWTQSWHKNNWQRCLLPLSLRPIFQYHPILKLTALNEQSPLSSPVGHYPLRDNQRLLNHLMW